MTATINENDIILEIEEVSGCKAHASLDMQAAFGVVQMLIKTINAAQAKSSVRQYKPMPSSRVLNPPFLVTSKNEGLVLAVDCKPMSAFSLEFDAISSRELIKTLVEKLQSNEKLASN